MFRWLTPRFPSLTAEIGPGSAREAKSAPMPAKSAAALKCRSYGFRFRTDAPGCTTILLAPVRFLHRLGNGLILTLPRTTAPVALDRSRQKCRGDGFGCDRDIGAFCSSGQFQTPFILRPQAPDRSARRHPVRLWRPAAAASGSGSPPV